MQHSPYTPCTDHPEDWWLPPTWPSPHAMVARPFRGRGKRGVHGTSYQFQQLSLHSSSAAEAAHRASRPFPRPKRSMRLSPHCAFQLGPGTHEEQTRGHPRGGAPVGQPYRHLLSSLHLLASLFHGLTLADLHPVRAITARRLATTPPPPSLPCAGMLAPPRGA